MTANELVSDLMACGQQELDVLLIFIADRIYECRLSDGRRILDATDIKQFLQECASVFHTSSAPQLQQLCAQRTPPSRFESVCNRCGHEHLDAKVCNFPIGVNQYCPCVRENANA